MDGKSTTRTAKKYCHCVSERRRSMKITRRTHEARKMKRDRHSGNNQAPCSQLDKRKKNGQSE